MWVGPLAVAGLWRRWRGAGLGGWRGGAGGVVVLFLAVDVSVIMQRQFPAVLCPWFSSSTVVGNSCYACRDGYPQCKLRTRSSRFLWCRSWTGSWHARCATWCTVRVSRSSTSPSWRRCRFLWSPYSEKHRDSSVAVHWQGDRYLVCRSCSIRCSRAGGQSISHSCAVEHGTLSLPCPSLCNDSCRLVQVRKLRMSRSCSTSLWSMSLLCRWYLGSSSSWTRSLTRPLCQPQGCCSQLKCLRFNSSPVYVDFPVVQHRRVRRFQHFWLWRRCWFLTHFASFFALLRLSRSWAPVFGALDGEEFFAIEGSPCQLDYGDVDMRAFIESSKQQQQEYNLGRLRFYRRGASTPLWGVEACSPPSRRPNPIPAIPPYVVRTPHLHGAPTTEETIQLWYSCQQ